jgi:hypothetical protein
MAEQEMEQKPQQKEDPAEIEKLEVTELEDEDVEGVSGGHINGNCPCSET